MINELLQHTLAASAPACHAGRCHHQPHPHRHGFGFADTPSRSLGCQCRRFVAYGPGKSEIRPLETDGRTSRRYCRRYEERRLATVASWEAVKRNNTPERHGDPQNDRSLRRDRCHLRSTPECHLRRFLPLFQERECLRVERRFGCRQFQPCLSGDYPRRTDKTRRRSGCLYTPAARPRGDDRAC